MQQDLAALRAAAERGSIEHAFALAQALVAPQDPSAQAIDRFFAAHAGATPRTLAGIQRLLTKR